MWLELKYGEKRIEVVITGRSGQKAVSVEGREISGNWIRTSPNQYSLILDGQVFDLTVEFSDRGCFVSGRHGTVEFAVLDPRRVRINRRIEEERAGLRRIMADMPGKVVRLLVRVGDMVSFDQGLLVVEAMKMQNEIRAPRSGVVKEIGVQEGNAVNHGDFLLSLE